MNKKLAIIGTLMLYLCVTSRAADPQTNADLMILPVTIDTMLSDGQMQVREGFVTTLAGQLNVAITNTPQTRIYSDDEMEILTTNNFHLRPGGDGLIETGDDLTLIAGAGYVPFELKSGGDQSTFATKNAALYYAGLQTWTRSNEVATTEGNLTIGASTAVKIIAPTTIASNLIVTGTIQHYDAVTTNQSPTKAQLDGTNLAIRVDMTNLVAVSSNAAALHTDQATNDEAIARIAADAVITNAAQIASNAAWHINGDNAPTATMNCGYQRYINMLYLQGDNAFYDLAANVIYDNKTSPTIAMDLRFRRAYSYTMSQLMFDWSSDTVVNFQGNEIRTTGYLTGKVKNGSATNDPVNVQQLNAVTNAAQIASNAAALHTDQATNDEAIARIAADAVITNSIRLTNDYFSLTDASLQTNAEARCPTAQEQADTNTLMGAINTASNAAAAGIAAKVPCWKNTYFFLGATNTDEAWQEFPTNCTLTSVRTQCLGMTGVVDIVRKFWTNSTTDAWTINTNVPVQLGGLEDTTFDQVSITNRWEVGVKVRYVSSWNWTNWIKVTIEAQP